MAPQIPIQLRFALKESLNTLFIFFILVQSCKVREPGDRVRRSIVSFCLESDLLRAVLTDLLHFATAFVNDVVFGCSLQCILVTAAGS